MCWVSTADDESRPTDSGGPAMLFTLVGAQTWCADRIQGLTDLKGAKSATANAG